MKLKEHKCMGWDMLFEIYYIKLSVEVQKKLLFQKKKSSCHIGIYEVQIVIHFFFRHTFLNKKATLYMAKTYIR